MCFIPCELCGRGLSFDNEHVCKREDILKRIDSLEEQVRDNSHKLNQIRERALVLVSDYVENNTVGFNEEKLDELWRALKLTSPSTSDYRCFTSQWLGLHLLYCVVSDVFDQEHSRHSKESRRFFLKQALEQCLSVTNSHGYTHDFLTVDELIQEIKGDL